jgi:serine/threonine protein kinase/Tfp pilus assembly protein PilF
MIFAPGTKLGPYDILAAIGAGGMGEVYRAKDTRLGRTVAIKVLNKEHMQRFEHEARAIAALNHPHICTLHDIGPDYLVMEYVDGAAIKGPLPVKQAVRLAIQIAGALDEAHRNGILHRDLKPGNIMVSTSGAIKLLDFGLAKLAAGADSETASTIEGTVMGTPAYMSPEQAQGKPVDARSDIFSFGAVLYEIVSGSRPFEGTSTAQVLSAVLRDEPKPLETLPKLERIVMRCLAKQPAQRYQTMAEVKAALEQVGAKSEEQQPSIAVLPFTDMSPDKDNEWFSDGLAEEIINALAQIPGLMVIARTSSFAFRGKEQDITKIAEALRVRTILEGSVRKSGNRIRVTAQLITAANGSHLWSERYDRDLTDVFAIQDEIAAAIAGALKVKLSVEPAARRRHEPNPAAHEAYLKALYHFGKLRPESLALCKEYFKQAIALDPEFALAHCGYADYFALLSILSVPANEVIPQVRDEARKALEIDPSLPEAHAMLGMVAGVYDCDWKEAERHFRLAMACDPVPPFVRAWYGCFYLLQMGRPEDAVRQLEQALKEDPLNIMWLMVLAASLWIAGRLAEAQAEARKALEFDENNGWALLYLAIIPARQGKWTEALPFAEKAAPMITPAIGCLAGVLKRMGEVNRAEELLQKLMPGETYGTALGLCYFHLACGEIDRAADWLEKAIKQRHPNAFAIASLFRASSRWPTLAKLMNLPEDAQ